MQTQKLNYFRIKNLKYDLINKFYYNKTKNLSELKKITLNFNCKTTNIEKLTSSLLAFKLIVKQKGKLVVSKNAHVLLKIKKGNPIGCKTVLNNKIMFYFIEKFRLKLFKSIKHYNLINKCQNRKSFSIEIKDTFNSFNELKTNFYFFSSLNNLEINFLIKSKTNNELYFILKSFKLVY